MIEVFGPKDNKKGLILPVKGLIKTLSVPERGQTGLITAKGEVRKILEKESCVAVARASEDELMSMVVGLPHINQGVCFLMAATNPEFRRQGWYGQVKKALVTACLACKDCPIERVITETQNPSVDKISRSLGFMDYSDGLALWR